MAAVETDAELEHPRHAVPEPVRSSYNASMKDLYGRQLAPTAAVYSDGFACFAQPVDARHAHSVLVTGGGPAATQAPSARWANVTLASAHRAISSHCHTFNYAKYAGFYPRESQYRFNRRLDLAATVQRVLPATMLRRPSAEPTLRATDNFHN